MHLYLIGPRGSGKSTVARQVARRLDRPLWSTDEAIQTTAGKTITELFQSPGEAGFRDLESEALANTANSPAAVIDLGGGAILRESNRCLIREAGKAVWLFAEAEILWRRICDDPRSTQTRPPLKAQSAETLASNGLVEIRLLVRERESFYEACADYEIDTGSLSVDEVARRIVAWFDTVDKSRSRFR